MNPSYPGSSGDRGHGPPQPPSMGSGAGGLNKGGQSSHGPPHSFHSQPPLTQLAHPGHHSTGLHPLHGGSGHGTHGNSILHGGPPPLPPPPLTSTLGQGNTSRSPHHPLSGSLLHPPRSGLSGTGGPSVLNKPSGVPGGLGPNVSGGQGSSAASVLMSHRLTSQSMGQPGGNSGPSLPAPGGLKTVQSFDVRPPSPRRDGGGQGGQSNQSQGGKQQYGNDSGGDYYSTSSMSMGPPPPRHRELRVEDALLYLDQVKQQFGDQPDIYNQFLDVMKDFKAQTIDTPGVIMRVSSLFRGYPNLILGFNTFLPPGYRIRPDTSIEVIPQQMSRPMNAPPSMYSNVQAGPQGAQAMGQGVHRPPPVTIPPPYSPPSLSGSHHSKQPTPSRQNLAPGGHPGSQKMGSQQSKQGSKKPQQPLQPAGNAGAAQNQGGNGGRGSANPVEFDHAIHYVTTIKQRFADEPETYKEFLAILHTYQKEQRSIRQVLDQVSYLFRDHPDLLREFTFFLPDGVQAIATERLNIAAAKAEAMKEMAKTGKYPRDGYGYPQSSSRRDDGRMRGGDSPSAAAMKRTHGDELGDDLRGKYKQSKGDGYKHPSPHDDRSGKSKDRRDRDMNKMLFNHKRSKRRSYDTKERRQFLALSDVLIDKEEWGIFEKIKKILPSRDSWREFLKCLELYSQEVLGRQEMLSLVKNLFGRHKDLVDEFDNLLCTHGEQKDPNEIWPFIPLAETDLSQCRRATPSYRGLPASYPVPPCSFRSKLEKAVCNDAWVSVPTGSEDFSFKNMRKNQYEEALFKCEDERFEIDMVIDANASTISVLEPLAREIEVLKEKDGSDDKLWNYVVDKGTFRVTHLNAISRIYGEAGAQILELLRKYPAGAIPVILKRLKQKDEEWRKARQDLNKQWKEVNEKNYHKSLDHSSFYFKQKDKKQTSMKVLVQEAKKKLEADEKKASDTKADAAAIKDNKAPPEAAAIADALKKEQADTATENGEKAPSSTEWKDHFKYRLAAVQIHKDAFGLLSYAAEKNLGVADKEKVSKVWQSFFSPFFHLEEEWLVRKPKHTTVSLEKAKMLRPGTEVTTDFGEGTVQYFNHERGVCVVNLPMGQGYLQPNAITIQETSDFPPSLAILDDEEDANKLQDKQKSTLFAPQHAYVFLRLYQMLHSRLERAFELCEKAKRNRHRRTINPAARALDHARASSSDLTGAEKTGDYQAFLTKLYALIDGSVDNTKYEDCCRSLMGSTSYFLFTMDKLVTLVLKQMQYMATDDTCQELLKLFAEQNTTKSSSTDIPDVEAYLAKTKGVFEGEGAYRLEFKPGVLRRTPLEPRVVTPAASSVDFKIWAPSPRVRQQEPSKWLIEPELSIQYLGSVDDEGDDDDDDESPIATPPETPSQTPVFGSPYHESLDDGEIKKEDSQDADQDVEMESGVEASSDEEDNSSKDAAANILKKRARHSSEDDSASQDKRLKTDDDDKEEGEDDGTDEAMDDASADEVTSEHTASSDDGAKSDANSEKSKGDMVAEGASSTENGSSTSSKYDKASS